MQNPVASATVETVLRKLLTAEGCTLSPPRGHGETGVDIKASKGTEDWHIEAIGYKKSGPARAKDFFEAFFRAVSRLNEGAKHCVIALAKEAEVGLPARAKNHGEAWRRIGVAFPELEIWLVDVQAETYSKHSWSKWLETVETSKLVNSPRKNLPEVLKPDFSTFKELDPLGKSIADQLLRHEFLRGHPDMQEPGTGIDGGKDLPLP